MIERIPTHGGAVGFFFASIIWYKIVSRIYVLLVLQAGVPLSFSL